MKSGHLYFARTWISFGRARNFLVDFHPSTYFRSYSSTSIASYVQITESVYYKLAKYSRPLPQQASQRVLVFHISYKGKYKYRYLSSHSSSQFRHS